MPTTLTSTLVNAIRAGTKNLPIVPGRPMATIASFTFSGATVTVGQVVQMIPIPSGAEILDIWLTSEWTGSGAGVFSVGDGSTTNRYVLASASLTASSRITRAAGGLGYKYSVSDDVATGFSRFDTIDVNIGAGATQTFTGSILMAVYWRYVGETNEQQ